MTISLALALALEYYTSIGGANHPPPKLEPTMRTLSIAALRQAVACELDARIADLAAHLGRTPAEDEEIPLSTWWVLPSTSVAERIWSLRLIEGGLEIAVDFARRAAARFADRDDYLAGATADCAEYANHSTDADRAADYANIAADYAAHAAAVGCATRDDARAAFADERAKQAADLDELVNSNDFACAR